MKVVLVKTRVHYDCKWEHHWVVSGDTDKGVDHWVVSGDTDNGVDFHWVEEYYFTSHLPKPA